MKKRIQKFTFTEEDVIFEDCDEILNCFNDSGKLQDYLKGIRDEAKCLAETTTESRINGFYCPELVECLLKLAKYFPIWTNVIYRYFPS